MNDNCLFCEFPDCDLCPFSLSEDELLSIWIFENREYLIDKMISSVSRAVCNNIKK